MKDPVVIRAAALEDLEALARIESACFPPAEAAGRETLKQRMEAFLDCFFVAETGGTPVGFIDGCVTDSPAIEDILFEDASRHNPLGAYQSVFGLSVLPEYQRRGIAAQLLQQMIAWAKESGRKGVILTCKEHLLPYYSRFGFENQGVSASVHGGAVWYDMLLRL